MSHINLFQTNAEFLSAYTGTSYVEPWVSYTMETSGIAYNKGIQPHDYSQDYLTFVMLEDGGTITTSADGVSFSNDGGETWIAEEISGLNAGDKVFVKGSAPGMSSDTALVHCDKKYNVEGNIMSVYDSENFRTRTTFDDGTDSELSAIFAAEINLISAENLILPVTALTNACYSRMFQYCTSLTTAPELPATTLTSNCYGQMFEGCTSLTAAPELPATTLAFSCYYKMFYDCTNLNYIKCLATDISAYYCTDDWVNGVAETGTFIKDASMTGWERGYYGIPEEWTVQDA